MKQSVKGEGSYIEERNNGERIVGQKCVALSAFSNSKIGCPAPAEETVSLPLSVVNN